MLHSLLAVMRALDQRSFPIADEQPVCQVNALRSCLVDGCPLLYAFDSLHCLMTTSALRAADAIRACYKRCCSSGNVSSLRYGFVRTHMCILRVSVKTGGLN